MVHSRRAVLVLVGVGVLGLGLAGMSARADEPAKDGAKGRGVEAKAAFERLKALAGEWKKVPGDEKEHGHGTGAEKEVYSVKSGGSTVMQVQFPGSSHEMISMYHLDGDDLKMTHYCAIGNQPRLKLDRAASTADTLVFVFDGGTNFDPARDMHIHGLTIKFLPGGILEESWQSQAKGKPGEGMVIRLNRS